MGGRRAASTALAPLEALTVRLTASYLALVNAARTVRCALLTTPLVIHKCGSDGFMWQSLWRCVACLARTSTGRWCTRHPASTFMLAVAKYCSLTPWRSQVRKPARSRRW